MIVRVVAVLLAFATCVSESDHLRLTRTEVIQLAAAGARRHGYKLHQYEPPTVRYERSDVDQSWWVHYAKKKKYQKGDFDQFLDVSVDDDTKKVWLIPSR